MKEKTYRTAKITRASLTALSREVDQRYLSAETSWLSQIFGLSSLKNSNWPNKTYHSSIATTELFDRPKTLPGNFQILIIISIDLYIHTNLAIWLGIEKCEVLEFFIFLFSILRLKIKFFWEIWAFDVRLVYQSGKWGEEATVTARHLREVTVGGDEALAPGLAIAIAVRVSWFAIFAMIAGEGFIYIYISLCYFCFHELLNRIIMIFMVEMIMDVSVISCCCLYPISTQLLEIELFEKFLTIFSFCFR